MLKQSSNGMKKVLAIFMAVLFGVSLTAVAVSAEPSVVKDKKIVVNSETNKNMNMKEHGHGEHGYEGHGHEEHGYEEHRHEGHGPEGHGHEEHGYGY
jgi:ABC-type Zn2+ transport system substrate-binding protein/surface adhesin